MKHAVAAFHPALQRIRVHDVALDVFHPFVFQRSGLLSAKTGRGIDSVAPAERPHALAPLDQGLDQTRADKTGGPGDEDLFAIVHAEGSFGPGTERLLYSRRAAHAQWRMYRLPAIRQRSSGMGSYARRAQTYRIQNWRA